MPGRRKAKKEEDNKGMEVWKEAGGKWKSHGYNMAGYHFGYCKCEEDGCRYFFITKKLPDSFQCPAGSSCSEKAERKELMESAGVHAEMLRLYWAVEDKDFLTLSPDLFSDRVLKILYEDGAFPPMEYNNYAPETDYWFLVRMIYMEDKSRITQKQQRKIAALLVNSIKPYLKKKLADKVPDKRS